MIDMVPFLSTTAAYFYRSSVGPSRPATEPSPSEIETPFFPV